MLFVLHNVFQRAAVIFRSQCASPPEEIRWFDRWVNLLRSPTRPHLMSKLKTRDERGAVRALMKLKCILVEDRLLFYHVDICARKKIIVTRYRF